MKKAIVLICFALISAAGYSQSQKLNLDKKKLAIGGYDPVSYFSNNPVKGESSINVTHKGAKYYFANNENKKTFEGNPGKYAPQYGGWCAYAMGVDGSKVKVDPETYKLVDGKLYLFYNFRKLNTLTLWNENESQFKSVADKNWDQ